MGSNKLTILQINDTHGYLEEHQEMFWDAGGARHEKIGGYSKISGYFKQVRGERGADAVIALDNGDTLHGTFPAVHSKGEAFIEPLNALKLDAWTIHWDIVYGPDKLKELTGKLDYPLLAINGYHEESDERAFQPSLVVTRGGVKVGIIGIAAYIIDKTFPKRFSTGLRFTLGKDELPAEIKRLREKEGAELIIVLTHLGFPQDCQLASEVGGIDILLSGHTHHRIFEPTIINGATIIQSGCHASFVGRLDVEMENGKVTNISHELVKLDEAVESDAEMQKIVDEIYSPHHEMLSEVGRRNRNRSEPLYNSGIYDGQFSARRGCRRCQNGDRLFQRLALRCARAERRHHRQRSVEHHPDQPAGFRCRNDRRGTAGNDGRKHRAHIFARSV